jgi:hypothetical protein
LIKRHAVSCTLILTFLVVMAVALLLSPSTTFLVLKKAWADSVIRNIHVGDTPTEFLLIRLTATLT